MEIKPINTPFSELSLPEAQAFVIATVKAHAKTLIEELEGLGGWRMMRAKEQDLLEPQEGTSRYMELITAKEAIRQASNAAETAILSLTSIEDLASLNIADYFALDT